MGIARVRVVSLSVMRGVIAPDQSAPGRIEMATKMMDASLRGQRACHATFGREIASKKRILSRDTE